MANQRLSPEQVAQLVTARCGSSLHVGDRVRPAADFYPSQLRKKYGAYCAECYREWKRRKDARTRGDLATENGVDYTRMAEARLFPGRDSSTFTPGEFWAAIEYAKDLARADGVYPPLAR